MSYEDKCENWQELVAGLGRRLGAFAIAAAICSAVCFCLFIILLRTQSGDNFELPQVGYNNN